ncbi:MAG: hypothetical protein AAFV25_21385, partial [Bacteroidota bacterium]
MAKPLKNSGTTTVHLDKDSLQVSDVKMTNGQLVFVVRNDQGEAIDCDLIECCIPFGKQTDEWALTGSNQFQTS